MTQRRFLSPFVAFAAAMVLGAPARAEIEGDELDFEPDEAPDADDESASDGDERFLPDGGSDDASESGVEPAGPLYPRALVQRPLTLPAGVAETALEARTGVRELVGAGTSVTGTEAYRTSATLSVEAGLTDEAQIGLSYGAGSVGEDGTFPGQAAALEAVYAINRYIGAQLALPFHIDPFALGLTLGAPVKLVVGDKVALMAGHDLVTFRLSGFQPHVDEAAENDNLADAVATNTVVPGGEYAFRGAALYQHSESLALGGEIALRAIDFDSRKPVVPIFARIRYTPIDYVDLGARVGLFNLDGPGENFGGSAFAAIRM